MLFISGKDSFESKKENVSKVILFSTYKKLVAFLNILKSCLRQSWALNLNFKTGTCSDHKRLTWYYFISMIIRNCFIRSFFSAFSLNEPHSVRRFFTGFDCTYSTWNGNISVNLYYFFTRTVNWSNRGIFPLLLLDLKWLKHVRGNIFNQRAFTNRHRGMPRLALICVNWSLAAYTSNLA